VFALLYIVEQLEESDGDDDDDDDEFRKRIQTSTVWKRQFRPLHVHCCCPQVLLVVLAVALVVFRALFCHVCM